MSGSVKVDPGSLIKYGNDVAKGMADAQGDLAEPFTGIGQHAQAAFLSFSGGMPMPEARTVVAVNSRNLQDFQAFLKDVMTGLQAINSAATSMAVVYMTTDQEQANSVNSVDFAFAGTSGAPQGFPKTGVSTMSAQQQAADDSAGRYTSAGAAASNPEMLQYATKTPVAGGFLYTFADGSKLQVVDSNGQSAYRQDQKTTMTVFKKDQDKPASIITTGQSTDYSGQPTKSRSVQSMTSSGQYVSSSESTTHLANGGVTVTTSTTNADGTPTENTTTVQPTKEPQPADQPVVGEVEKREGQYNSHGSNETKTKYGMA